MSSKKIFRFATASITILTILFLGAMPAQADIQPQTESPACLKCHEDLYYLHDTGKWYCINEASDRCVLCHGGDPTTLVKEEAHYNRAAHPVINEDISKCQQCHPTDCNEHVVMFEQVAGINPVRVAVAYTPSLFVEAESTLMQRNGPNWEEILRWSLTGGTMLLLLIGSIALYCRMQDKKYPHQ